jgi:hypothetical protein
MLFYKTLSREAFIKEPSPSLSHCSSQNLLCVKAAFATLRKTLRCFALTRKFLPAY